MAIQITQTFAKIGVETTHGKLDIRTQNADLELQHKAATLEMHTDLPRVIISSQECFNEEGHKDLVSFSEEAVQLAKQAVSNYISKVSSDGRAYGEIENGNNPLPSIVIRDAYPQHEFAIDSIPKSKPDIQVTGGVHNTAVNALQGANNGVEGTYTRGSVKIDVTPSDVKVFLRQNPSIDVKYIGKNVDVYK
jgi:hypothetical protein